MNFSIQYKCGMRGGAWRRCVRDLARADSCGTLRAGARGRRAFTLIDLLVSLAVIAVLIRLLLPSLAGVRETTRQVVCRSNVRQLGIGIAIYAEDQKDMMPSSIYAPSIGPSEPHRTTLVRRNTNPVQWDGLGVLYAQDYLPSMGVFYCPSHSGDHPISRYSQLWTNSAPGGGEVICNYQYRGYSLGTRLLTMVQRRHPMPALISDGLMTQNDYNHRVSTFVPTRWL